jgi:hypothetical protein
VKTRSVLLALALTLAARLAHGKQMPPGATGPNGVLWPQYKGYTACECGASNATQTMFVCDYPPDGAQATWSQ